jgi:hypothetical protein
MYSPSGLSRRAIIWLIHPRVIQFGILEMFFWGRVRKGETVEGRGRGERRGWGGERVMSSPRKEGKGGEGEGREGRGRAYVREEKAGRRKREEGGGREDGKGR